jgi:hypothetical protein
MQRCTDEAHLHRSFDDRYGGDGVCSGPAKERPGLAESLPANYAARGMEVRGDARAHASLYRRS